MYFPYNFLIFSLTYFTVRIQNMTHITYKIWASQLLLLPVRPPANRRLSAVKFWLDFPVGGESAPLTPESCKGQLPSHKSATFLSPTFPQAGVLIISSIPLGAAV